MPVDLERLARLKEENLSVREIAKELKVSAGIVVNRSGTGLVNPVKEKGPKAKVHETLVS